MSNSELDTKQAEISAGALLRTAREKAGMDQTEVAASLHLLPRQINAIEQDDYKHFSAAIFCRGYIKAYAKLLELDPQPLLAAYEQLCPPSEDKQLQAAKSKVKSRHSQPGRSIYYWSFAATLLVAVILWSYGSSYEVNLSSQFPEASREVVVDKNALIGNAPAIELVSQTETGAAIETVVAGDDMALAVSTVPKLVEQPASTIGEQPLLAAASLELKADRERSEEVFIVSTHDDNSLSFIFEEDCWVEVKDRDNQVIFANLKRANDTLTLSGKAPFKVLLGYAHGVKVNYNGEPVSFDVNRQNNAARMTIGRR